MLISCSEPDLKDVQSFADAFSALCGVTISSTFEFTDIEDKRVAGRCLPHTNHILIDTEEWERITDLQKEFLVLHEIGHCQWGLPHENSTRPGGVGSFMYPQIPTHGSLHAVRAANLVDLCDRAKGAR